MSLFWGSSPRLRGTRTTHRRLGLLDGIIPALAGNTSAKATSPTSPRDHPRACGEHYWRMAHAYAPSGSSPRLRGTQHHHKLFGDVPGIIPALAGNTMIGLIRAATRGDHPRACGEHRQRTAQSARRTGSSPRLRGTLTELRLDIDGHGIIPALAGNTLCPMRR